jgi:hypothetical protein
MMMSISEQLKNPDNACILLVSGHRKIVGFTPNLLSIWNLPEVIIKSLSEQLALEFVSKQFDNPQLFLKDMIEIYEQRNLVIKGKVQLKDGRIIQRHSEPLCLNGVYAGRLWMFEQN